MRSSHRSRSAIVATVAALSLLSVGALATSAATASAPSPADAPAIASNALASGDVRVAAVCTRTLSGTIAGAQTVAAGERLCLRDALVDGAVTVLPGGNISVRRTTINGALTSNDATGFKFCGSATVGGAIHAIGGTGVVLVGDGINCSPNTVGGAVELLGNAGPVTIGVTTMTGALDVSDNVTVAGTKLRIYANDIGGALSCAGNDPAPINIGRSNSVAGARSGQCIAEDF